MTEQINDTIFGINAVRSRVLLGAKGIVRLLIRNGTLSDRLQSILDLAGEMGCSIDRISDVQLDEMTSVSHQGVGLELDPPVSISEDFLYKIVDQRQDDLLLLVLDGITDPRNLGACLRSAATFGVDAVIVPKDNSAGLNDAAIKTASGGASHVPLVRVVNLARCLRRLKKDAVWVVGTLLSAETSITDTDMRGKIALVMGSEEKGLRHNTIKCCDFLVNIPMVRPDFGLNVSVAAGICLHEANRQRSP